MPTEYAYSSGHLVLSHFGTCMCSNVDTNLSWTCLVSGPLNFEHPSVLLFCLTPCRYVEVIQIYKRKRKRSDSVLWRKPLRPQRNPTSNATTHKRLHKLRLHNIADRLVTVSCSNDSHPTGVIKPVYRTPTFPLTAKVVSSNIHTFKHLSIILLIKAEDQLSTKADRP